MKVLFSHALIMSALLLLSGPVFAQSALEGLVSTGIVVETLDEDALNCGLTTDALDAAVRLPLSNSRLHISNNSSFLYVSTTALLIGSTGNCAVFTRISFRRGMWTAASNGEEVTTEVWQKSILSTGPKLSMGTRVADNVEGFTKQFIAAWLKAQK